MMMVLVLVLTLCTLGFLMFSMVRSIQNERSAKRGLWREFSLGLALMILFFVTWLAQGIAEWQVFTDEQRAHGEPTEAGDFVSQFAQSTMENWQSEFLQLFSFVVLAALYIHKGQRGVQGRHREARGGAAPDRGASRDTPRRCASRGVRELEVARYSAAAQRLISAGRICRGPSTPLTCTDAVFLLVIPGLTGCAQRSRVRCCPPADTARVASERAA
jgi:hypothetical protein